MKLKHFTSDIRWPEGWNPRDPSESFSGVRLTSCFIDDLLNSRYLTHIIPISRLRESMFHLLKDYLGRVVILLVRSLKYTS